MGWLSSERLYSVARPSPPLDAAFRTAPPFEMDPTTKYTREWGTDIASLAFAAAGATEVEQTDWWMMKEDGSACTPTAGLDFVVSRLKCRLARRHPIHLGQWGVRLGPNAGGAMAQNFGAPS